MLMQTLPNGLMRYSLFHALSAWGLACCFTGMTLSVSAQPDTFGGNPDSSGFTRIPSDTDDWTRHFRIGGMVYEYQRQLQHERFVQRFRQ